MLLNCIHTVGVFSGKQTMGLICSLGADVDFKAAPHTSLIQRGCVKCGTHILVECFQLDN